MGCSHSGKKDLKRGGSWSYRKYDLKKISIKEEKDHGYNKKRKTPASAIKQSLCWPTKSKGRSRNAKDWEEKASKLTRVRTRWWEKK